MNGRVYDYNLGRFLSVDPFIQDPGNSQSLNPYSYIMNNPLAGTDPSGYKSKRASAGSTTIWDRNWGNVLSFVVENKNGERTAIQVTRGELERGKVEQLENIKLEDIDSIMMVETSPVEIRSQTGSTNRRTPRRGGRITNGIYNSSVSVNTLETLESDWRGLLNSEDITSLEWVHGQDKLLRARFDKRRIQSAEWRVQARLANMRIVRDDIQGGASMVMGTAVSIPYIPTLALKYGPTFISMMNSQTPIQALLISGTSNGFISTGLYEVSATLGGRDTNTQGYVTAFGIGFLAGGIQGWGVAMSGSYTYFSIENLIWHTNIIAITTPLDYINLQSNTKEKE